MEPDPSQQQGMCGYLLKKGVKGLWPGWKRRWFRFTGEGLLSWYEGMEETPELQLGRVSVDGECLVRGAQLNGPDPLGFELVTPGRVYQLRAETSEDLQYWTVGLTRAVAQAQADEEKQRVDDETAAAAAALPEEITEANTSVDYITIDLNSSVADTSAASLESSRDDEPSPAVPVTVIESEPRSSGVLMKVQGDQSPLAQATRVVTCLKTLLGPPPRSGPGPVGPILRGLHESQVDWMAPLLLALEQEDVTEVLLHLAAAGSPSLRLHLICLHASGFTASYARASVNSLFDISERERNTLRLVTWLSRRPDLAAGRRYAADVVHPMTGQRVDHLRIVKVFATSARPLMVQLEHEGTVVPPLILTKQGDDLRVDLQVQVMMRLFSALWELHGYQFRCGQLPYCVTYRVCPFSDSSGVLEVVPRCASLYEHRWDTYDKHRTISSAIGAFVSGYVLGVRDRHKDNILFSLDSLELFHVDFGYVFNAQTRMFDAPRFAISSEFKNMLLETGQWERAFVDNAVIAFRILRQNRDFIIGLCSRLFSGTHPQCATYLKDEAFLGDLTDEQADQRIRYLVEHGPRSIKRVAKNVSHALGF